jgi:hypothetical protein
MLLNLCRKNTCWGHSAFDTSINIRAVICLCVQLQEQVSQKKGKKGKQPEQPAAGEEMMAE